MRKDKFEFTLEEDQGFIFHNESPKFQVKLGDDDNLISEVTWETPVKESTKAELIEKMKDWYWHEFHGLKRQ